MKGGGANSFYPLKGGRGRKTFYPILRGAQKVSDPRFSHVVAPLPVINDQSIKWNLNIQFCTLCCRASGACLVSQWAFESAPDNQRIWLKDIDCSNTVEGDTLLDCRYRLLREFETLGCDHSKDIAFVCGGRLI